MRILVALSLALAACGGAQTTATATETDVAAESCCCKYTPVASETALPVYEPGNRMECSARQGECVADVQCESRAEAE